MDRVKLDPLVKTYYFKFDEYSCNKCKSGICPLDNLTLDEIRNLQKVDNSCMKENSAEYCTELARRILNFDNDEFYDFTRSIWLYYNEKCGHYTVEGQHRTCIIARIYQKGGNVKYRPHFTTQYWQCLHCIYKEHYTKLENSLNFFDKLFKTKKYKEVIEYKKRRQIRSSLYDF